MKFKVENIKINRVRDNDATYGSWDKYRRARDARGVIYLWPKGENAIDNLVNRRTRPYNDYKKDVIPEILTAMELPSDTKVRWSQKAGCSCGCSPGFVLDDVHGVSVHVDITLED